MLWLWAWFACGGAPEESGEGLDPSGISVIADRSVRSVYLDGAGIAVRVLSLTGVATTPSVRVTYAVDEPVVFVLLGDAETAWEIDEVYPGTIQRVFVDEAIEAREAQQGFELLFDFAVPLVDAGRWGFEWVDGPVASDISDRLLQEGLEIHSLHFVTTTDQIRIEPGFEPNLVEYRPDCGVPGVPDAPLDGDTILARCPLQAVESHVCVAQSDEVVVIGAESGTVCSLGTPPVQRPTGIALGGSGLYRCEGGSSLIRDDLRTGRRERARVPACDGVAAADGGVVVNGSSYRNFAEVHCELPLSSIRMAEIVGSSAEGFLDGSWSDQLRAVDLDGRTQVIYQLAEDYRGVHQMPDGLVFSLMGANGEVVLSSYRALQDAEPHSQRTLQELSRVPVRASDVNGLYCIEGLARP